MHTQHLSDGASVGSKFKNTYAGTRRYPLPTLQASSLARPLLRCVTFDINITIYYVSSSTSEYHQPSSKCLRLRRGIQNKKTSGSSVLIQGSVTGLELESRVFIHSRAGQQFRLGQLLNEKGLLQ